METGGFVARGQAAFERLHWREAYDHFLAADAERPLPPADLERLAVAARLLGDDACAAALWSRAHHGYLGEKDIPRAARSAFWLALPLILRGDRAQGSGWLARGCRLLDDGGHDCPDRGYLMFGQALSCALNGDPRAARSLFAQAVAVGERFRDTDLIAFARHGEGRALIGMGEIAAGVALLDEVMIALTSGEASPALTGDIYCSVIEVCHEMLDIRRAHEWTVALSRWCEGQSELPPYRGQCLVHRAEMMLVNGDWPSAAVEAERARETLATPPPHRSLGAAYYQIGEVHRLRGRFAAAEEAYRQASRAGRDPQPGLALMRLAQGRIETARTAIMRAGANRGSRHRTALLLRAQVEIMLAGGDVVAAREAADRLLRLAVETAPKYMHAVSAHADGTVLLAEGDAPSALTALGAASSLWTELGARYEAARTRVAIGMGCRTLGDLDSSALGLEGALLELEALGAVPDAARVSKLVSRGTPTGSVGTAPLTNRELEVLRSVATGRTNRAIAGALGISEKTVARHVSNIFLKLDLQSRAAATAYAYEHGILGAST